jgi:hypothetical protein
VAIILAILSALGLLSYIHLPPLTTNKPTMANHPTAKTTITISWPCLQTQLHKPTTLTSVKPMFATPLSANFQSQKMNT